MPFPSDGGSLEVGVGGDNSVDSGWGLPAAGAQGAAETQVDQASQGLLPGRGGRWEPGREAGCRPGDWCHVGAGSKQEEGRALQSDCGGPGQPSLGLGVVVTISDGRWGSEVRGRWEDSHSSVG